MSRQLPQGWAERIDEKSGRKYYVNHETRQTSWTLPSEQPLPPGWEQQYDGKGRVFFINHEKQITTWTDPRNAPQQPAAQPAAQPQSQPSFGANRGASLTKILKPGTLIEVHKSAVESIAALVLSYDERTGTHEIALENGRTDKITLSQVSHKEIEDLMERIARCFVICEQAHQAFPPNSMAIQLSLDNITTTLKNWMDIYTSVDGSAGNVDKQSQLSRILSYFMDQRAALVLTQAMELGDHLGEAAVQTLAEINNVLRLADPQSVGRVSHALQEAGVTRGLVYLLRGGSPEVQVKILHVVSFFSGDYDMVRSFEGAGGVVLLCELLVNAQIQQHAVTVLQQMLAVDKTHIIKVIVESGGLQFLYLVLESSIGHVQKQALLVLQQVFDGNSAGDMSSKEIIEPLIRIVSKGGDAAPQAVEMLVPLARSSQAAASIVDAGAVSSMISICQSGDTSDALRVKIFELLHGIASTSPRCVQQLTQSAAPQLLLDVVSRTVSGGANHALISSALALLADLCENERVLSTVRAADGVSVLVGCLQSAVPPPCKESAVEILAHLAEGDASISDMVAASGAAEASIALLTGKSDKAKSFIVSLLNRDDVLQDTMASLRSNEPMLTLMVKSFVNQLRVDPTNYDPVFSLQKFCTLPDDGHVMLQMRRLQIANAAGAIPALIKLIREAGPLPMKMAAMSSIAELAKDPTTCSVLEESNAFAVICTGLLSWELPQLQEVALTILQCMFTGGLTLKTIGEAEKLAKALAACVVKDHVQVQTLALNLCEPLCAIETYRVEIGHIIAPSLASLFESGAAQMLPPDFRNSAIATLATLSSDDRTVQALVESGSVKSIAKILTSTLEEDILVMVLEILVKVAGTGAAGCSAFLESHENDLMKFVELLPPTPLQTEEVTSRALKLLTILSEQTGNIKQIMAIDGFLDKMLSSCQNDAFPEYRTALVSITQSKPDEAALVWEGINRRVDVSAALVLLDSKVLPVKTQAIEALASACNMRPEHAVARIVESGKIQLLTRQLQSTNQTLQQSTLTIISACARDSPDVRDVLVQNLQILVKLLLSYSTPVVASAISVLRELASHAEDFWPEVLHTTNRKLVIDCLAGLFARQSLDPAHRVEVSSLLTELLGRIDTLSEAERNVVSHTLHSTLTILKEATTEENTPAQLATLNQLLQKVPSCKSQLMRYPWLLPRLVRAAASGDYRVGAQLLQAYVDSESVKNDSIQLLVDGGGLSDLDAFLSKAANGGSNDDESSQQQALLLPIRLLAEIALGPVSIRTQFFESDVRHRLIGFLADAVAAISDKPQSGIVSLDVETAKAIFPACLEALGGLAAVGSLRESIASDETCLGILADLLSVQFGGDTSVDTGFGELYQAALPEFLKTLRLLAPFLAQDAAEKLTPLFLGITLPPLLAAVGKSKSDNGAPGAMLRAEAALDTLVLFVAARVASGAEIIAENGQLLLGLLQIVVSHPVSNASLTALKLLRMSLLLDRDVTEEILSRGGIDRLGTALAKAKRLGDDGAPCTAAVLRTLHSICTQAAGVVYFSSGKSPAVYAIVKSLANAKAQVNSPQTANSEAAAAIISLLGKDVRTRTDIRVAAQKKAVSAAKPAPAVVAKALPVRSIGSKASLEPPPPKYPPAPRYSSSASPVRSYPSPSGPASTQPPAFQAAPPSYAPPTSRRPLPSAPPPAPKEVRTRTAFLQPNRPLAAPKPFVDKSSSGPKPPADSVEVPALDIGDAPSVKPQTPPPAPAATKGPAHTSASGAPALPKPYEAPRADTSTANLGPPKYEPPPSFSYSSPGPAVGSGLPAPARSYSNPAVQDTPRFYEEPSDQQHSTPAPHAYNDYSGYSYETTPDPNITSNVSAASSGTSHAVEPGDSEEMKSLLALGFDRDQCAIALAQTDNKVDHAAALLYGEELPDETAAASSAAAASAADSALEIPKFDEGVRMNGLLMKRSAHLKQWRERFMVLKGHYLYVADLFFYCRGTC